MKFKKTNKQLTENLNEEFPVFKYCSSYSLTDLPGERACKNGAKF
jgi:hypothetical protein